MKKFGFIFKGFTLSEVLITLGIVGVVAALTIPNLLVNKEKQEYVNKTKKVYSTLEQTLKMAEIDYGSRSTWNYGTTTGNGDEAVAFANTYLIPYMNVSKNCGKATGCWASPVKRFDGTNSLQGYDDNSQFAKFILNDGTAIHIAIPIIGKVYLHFDINGPTKGPNVYGQDILTYSINQNLSNSVLYISLPRANLVDTGANACTKTAAQPDACLALIIKDGWTIADDYPWR